MKYLLAIKDIFLTMLCIGLFFFSLSFMAQRKIPISHQKSEVITLIPMEAFLRGSIKIDDDNSITNWRNNKNIVHWKFECIHKGKYKVNLIHSKTSKNQSVVFNCKQKTLQKNIDKNSKETELGVIEVSEGTHDIAFYAPEVTNKTKLPDIFSIILTRIN